MTSLELHAIWWESSLQVWGLPSQASHPATNPGLAAPSEILNSDALRRSIGDAWEPLLVSDATDGGSPLSVAPAGSWRLRGFGSANGWIPEISHEFRADVVRERG